MDSDSKGGRDDNDFDQCESNDDLRAAITCHLPYGVKKHRKARGGLKEQTDDVYPAPEVPPVKPIPFNLDDTDIDSQTTSSAETKVPTPDSSPEDDDDLYSGNVYNGCLLDLPLVYNVLKTNRIGIRRIGSISKQPRQKEVGSGDVVTLSHQFESLKFESNTAKKRKRQTRLHKINKTFFAQAKQQTETNLNSTGLGSVDLNSPVSSNDQLFQRICTLALWLNGIKGTENKTVIVEKWEQLHTSANVNDLPIDALAISKLLGVDKERMDRFGFFRDSGLIHNIRNTESSNYLFADLLKMIAFSLWQRGEMKKCAYYLIAAHGTFLKTEILDKHLGVMIADDEKKLELLDKKSTKAKARLEENTNDKALLYEDHMSGLKAFDYASDFQNKLNEINPDWNIVQVTSLFHYQNRFYTDVVGHHCTPGIFLTCLGTPYGTTERAIFTTYIPEPVLDPAISKWSLIEQYALLMIDNRLINSKNLERREYWETRAQHNRKMMSILAAIEENWIFPWNFLLCGNLMDKDLRNQIDQTVHQIELELKSQFTATQKLLLMKLMENFNTLPSIVKNSIGHLISHILNDFMSPVGKIANWVIRVGTSISVSSSRHSTIFVLDQEIEHLSWEWLACMRTTSATRIQSLPLLYSSFKLVTTRVPVDPKKCYFVLNPDQSLVNVQKRLKNYFSSRKEWDGITAQIPEQKIVDEVLQNQHIYLYCGHGNGQTFYPDYALQKIVCNAVPLLMGCGSAQYKCTGSKSYSSSVLNSYAIAMCRSVVGFLWEITDVECDRVTVELLERWIPAPKGTQLPEMGGFDTKNERPTTTCLATAVRSSRSAATQFMTEAAIVNYGLPVYIEETV